MPNEADELKAQLKALAEQRAADNAARAAKLEVAKLKQTLEDNKAIAKAEAELGEQGVKCACIPTPDGRVVILKRAAFAKYREYQTSKETGVNELEGLVESCLYYPDAEIFEAICEEYPGLLTVFGKAIAKLAGTLQEEAAKK